MLHAFNFIGKNAPLLIIAYTGYNLFFIKSRLYLMLATVIFSYILNVALKQTIKEPRTEPNIFRESPTERYGMPSGHMQLFTAVSTVYWLSMRSHPVWEWIGIGGLMAISAAERWMNRKHSVAQMVVGAIVGTITGWMMYLVAQKRY